MTISKTKLIILETNKLSMFHTCDLEQHLDIIKQMLSGMRYYEPAQTRYLNRIKLRIESELAERIIFAESKQQTKEVSNENIFKVYCRVLCSKLHL